MVPSSTGTPRLLGFGHRLARFGGGAVDVETDVVHLDFDPLEALLRLVLDDHRRCERDEPDDRGGEEQEAVHHARQPVIGAQSGSSSASPKT